MSRAHSTTETGHADGSGAKRRRRPLIGVAVALLLVAAVVAALTSTSRGSGEDLTVSYDPSSRELDFRAVSFAGEEVDSAALRGTPVVLNFYASWCTVCDRELPDFQRVAERLDGRLHVLGANPQSNDTDAAQAQMIGRSGITYPTFPDPQDDLLRQFNTTGGLPTTVFIDADGVVRKVYNGLLTERLLLDQIDTLLGVRA